MNLGTIAVIAVAAAIAVLVFLIVAPGRGRVGRARLDPTYHAPAGLLSEIGDAARNQLAGALQRQSSPGIELALERAGLRIAPQDFVLRVLIGLGVGAIVGFLLGGFLLSLLVIGLGILLVKVRLDSMAETRRKQFADQLDDSLQLISSSLRAGHSLPQALDSVAREAPRPTSEEFARIINETRVGRDLTHVLLETAGRMGSDDFLWAAQAIAINREVGGNLAEVLDGVGHTIRERNQIRRQVKALSAEGRLSGLILMLLPIGVAIFLMLVNPTYLSRMFADAYGWILLGIATFLFVIGGFWMRAMVRIKF